MINVHIERNLKDKLLRGGDIILESCVADRIA